MTCYGPERPLRGTLNRGGTCELAMSVSRQCMTPASFLNRHRHERRRQCRQRLSKVLLQRAKRIETVVPEYPESGLLTRIVPSCFSRMERLTQSPSPLPLSCLVVANGLKQSRFHLLGNAHAIVGNVN